MCKWLDFNFRSYSDVYLNGPGYIMKCYIRSPDRDFKPVPSEHEAGTGNKLQLHIFLNKFKKNTHNNYSCKILGLLVKTKPTFIKQGTGKIHSYLTSLIAVAL
jgi:hypothetical protein